MKKFIRAIVAVLGVAAALTNASAFANVITFDDANSNSVVYSTFSTFSDGGLTFTNFGSYAAIWAGSPNDNGTNSLIFSGFNTGDYLAITKTGGSLFDLSSIDLTISWYDPNPAETVLVNGSPITISQGMQTFALGLSGVSEVDITGVPSNSGYWALDNVNFASAVPEPASLYLVGLALAGLAAVRRLKKN